MKKMTCKHFSRKTDAVWKRAFSLVLALAMLSVSWYGVTASEEQAKTQYLVNEDFANVITDPSAHATPSISEWKAGQTTAQVTYRDGRVYFDKTNNGDISADFVLPLTKGYAVGGEPLAQGAPKTDLYIEFNWQAFSANDRLYIKGTDPNTGKQEQIFYLSQNNNRLVYTRADNKVSVTGTKAFNQTAGQTIRLLLQPNAAGSFTIVKGWINDVLDKDVNLEGNRVCSCLYLLAVDERGHSGTGLGTSFGSLKVWQPAEVQLQNIVDNNAVDLSFEDIRGENTDQNAVTENLTLPTGHILANGLKVAGWGSSNADIVSIGGVVHPDREEDKTVTLTPLLAIYDDIGDGSASFVAKDVTAEGEPITVTVTAQPDSPTPPEEPEQPDRTAVTQFLVNEDFEQAITEPNQHATPSISEWNGGTATARITYQNGRVYFDKQNSGAYKADMMLPLSHGYADGTQPASAGTPATDVYVEFNWQAHNTGTRLYLSGLGAEGKGTNLFYFTQSGNKLQYAKSDNSSTATSTVDMKQTEPHTIRLFLQRKGDTYAIAKTWIDGRADKDINLTASAACSGLYALVVDERRNSGTGLGSSFGSLRVWQPAEVQLQTMIDSGQADLSFADIKGANTDQNAVTENMALSTGQTLASGLVVVDWETSNADAVTKTGVVTRPAEADETVEMRPVLAIRDVIGDGSADFEPTDVTAAGKPIAVTVRSTQLEDVKETLSFAQIKGENIDAEHVESDLNLPTQINGVAITWQVKSITPGGTKAAVDTATGSVRRPAQEEQDVRVVMTALLSRGGVSDVKDISFTIKKMEAGEAEYLQQLLQRLTFAVIAGENTSEQQVMTDLKLPGKFNGAEVAWSSSVPSVVAENGKVNCPVYPAPAAEVVLTAALTFNGAGPVKKEFPITVLQGEAENLAKTAEIKTSLSGMTADKLGSIRDDNVQTYVEISARTKEFYITLDLKEKRNVSRLDFVTAAAENAAETALKGYLVETSDNGTAWTEIFSGTAVSGRNTADFKPINTRYIRLRVAEKAANTVERFAELAVRFCPEHRNLVDADAETLKIDLSSRITASTVTLPVKGSFGSDIVWSFSPAGIFEQTAAGVYKVTHGAADTTVSLIATFHSGNCTAQVRRTHTIAGSGSNGSGGGTGGGGGGSHSSTGSGSHASNIAIPSQSVPQPNQPNQKPAVFEDLKQAEWAAEYIETLYQDGIVNGKGEGRFAPLDSVTREEFVKMLVLALGLEAPQESAVFVDADSNAWYAPYIACAVQNGLVNGISDTVFGVGLPITREDMAVMAARAIRTTTGAFASASQPTTFGDQAQIADYAKESVALLSALGLLQGNETGNFCPQKNTSRAESAKILYMLRDAVK